MSQDMEFEKLVELHYSALYRFAYSLTRSESEASDLAQETFYIWAKSGDRLRDKTKAKSWLFTTLHREFLQARRKLVRFPETEFSAAESELPPVVPLLGATDAATILKALAQVDAAFQTPLALFYLEDNSYAEIGSILEIPLGTVKSRISRGIAQLQRLMVEPMAAREVRNP